MDYKNVVEATHFSASLVHSEKELKEVLASPDLQSAAKRSKFGKNFLVIVKDTRNHHVAGALRVVIYDDTKFDKVKAEVFPFYLKREYYKYEVSFPIKRLLLARAITHLSGAVDEIRLVAHKADMPFFRAHPEFFKEQRMSRCFEIKLPKRRVPIHQVVKKRGGQFSTRSKFVSVFAKSVKVKRH